MLHDGLAGITSIILTSIIIHDVPRSGAAVPEDEEVDVFQPAQCNVAFGSAHDGWAFRLDQFADMYAEKMGCK
jgi:hypothetical protein